MAITTPTVGRGRAGRDVAAQLALRSANLVLGVFVTLLMVRTLGEVGFGEWATTWSLIGLVGYFNSMGMDRVAIERATAEPERAASWVGALATLRMAQAPPLALAAAGLCILVADDASMRITGALLSLVIVIGAPNAVRAVFQLQVRNALVSAVEVGNGVAWAGAVTAVALFGGGIVALALAFLAVTALSNALYVALSLRAAEVRFRGTRPLWRELLRMGVPIGIGGMLVIAYGRIDQVLVFEIAGAQDAGLYGAAYRILDRAQFVPATLLTTLYPIILASRADPARLGRVFQLTFEYLLIAALPALAITIAGAEPLTVLLFGEEFREAAPALPILMGAFTVISVGYLPSYLVPAYRLQRRFVGYAAAALVFNVVANLVLLPAYGFVAAAWITLATELLVSAFTFGAVLRAMGHRPRIERFARIAAGGTGMALTAWALREAGTPLAVWVAAGTAVYVALLFATRAMTPTDVSALVRRRIA